MKEVYLLLPLLVTSNNIDMEVQRVMNIKTQQYTLHQVNDDFYAVQIHQNRLGYAELEDILKDYQHLQTKIGILENTLVNYDWNQRDVSIHASSIDSLMKRAIKYKQVKEENKKLKKLLQNQLENTQKVREETQKTMKVLRQEFDALVKEMAKQTSQPNAQAGSTKILIPQQRTLDKREHFDGRISNKF